LNTDSIKRITAYYELLAIKELNPLAGDTVENMLNLMFDEEVLALEEKLSANDSTNQRLMIYATRLSEMMVAETSASYGVDPQGKNAKVMNLMMHLLIMIRNKILQRLLTETLSHIKKNFQ